jgi:hypothetical protein
VLGESMGLELDQDDVKDFVKSHTRELTTEDCKNWTPSFDTILERKTKMAPFPLLRPKTFELLGTE